MKSHRRCTDCRHCHGSGYTQTAHYRTVADTTTSVVLGVALGMGYFPTTRQERVTSRNRCRHCRGTGRVEEPTRPDEAAQRRQWGSAQHEHELAQLGLLLGDFVAPPHWQIEGESDETPDK